MFLSSFSCFAQESLKEIFETQFDKSFNETCQLADQYFLGKATELDLSLDELKFEDGEFVKYNRWKTFWKQRLTEDGYLADLSSYHRNKEEIKSRSAGPLDDLEWNNISYTQDLGVQIGLGRTNSIAFHPTDTLTFYVAAAIGGIWKTTDGGLNYTAIGDDLPYLAVSCILVDQENPDNIYIATGDRVWYGPPSIGIYKSNDGGDTWEPTAYNVQFNNNIRVYWMAADPNDPNTMVMATSGAIVKTTDGWETFESKILGQFSDVKYMPNSSDTLYAVRSNANGLFRSVDGGENFSNALFVPGNQYKRLLTHDDTPSLIYVSANDVLYKSKDAANSFFEVVDITDSDTGDGIAMIAPQDTSKIYMGWFDVYQSQNGGKGIQQISHWLGDFQLQLIHVDQRNSFTNPLQPHLIYLCNDGGVYTVNTDDNRFTNLSNGLRITQYYDIGVSQTNPTIMSGGSQDNGNVFMEDGVWEMAAPTADGMMQGFSIIDEDIRYNAIQGGIIFKFENEFRSQISANIPDNATGNGEWVTPFLVDPNIPFSLIAGYRKVYRTFDRGVSWTAISDNLANGRNLDLLAIAPSNSERIYAIENYGTGTGPQFGFGHSASEIYVKSTENNNWDRKQIPVTEGVAKIIVDPNNEDHIYITCFGYVPNHKVFESYDAGDTWENISGMLPNVPCAAIAYHEAQDDVIFVGTDDGVFYTFKDFIDWQPAGDFPNTFISEIEIQRDAGLIRVGTHGRGIFEADINVDLTKTNELQDISTSKCQHQLILSGSQLTVESDQYDDPFTIVDLEGRKVMEGQSYTSVNVASLTAGIYLIKFTGVSADEECVLKFYKP